MQILEPTLDPAIIHPWLLVGKLMISRFPSSILRGVHVLIFIQHVSSLGIGVVVGHAKGMLFCFKGKHVRISGCHHIDMFHTHFVHSCHKGCCIKKSVSYAFESSMLCHYVSMCDHCQLLSMFTYVSLISHLAISQAT